MTVLPYVIIGLVAAVLWVICGWLAVKEGETIQVKHVFWIGLACAIPIVQVCALGIAAFMIAMCIKDIVIVGPRR